MRCVFWSPLGPCLCPGGYVTTSPPSTHTTTNMEGQVSERSLKCDSLPAGLKLHHSCFKQESKVVKSDHCVVCTSPSLFSVLYASAMFLGRTTGVYVFRAYAYNRQEPILVRAFLLGGGDFS